MEIETGRLPKDEQVPLLLRGLFEQRGYRRYRMSNFEAYDLYRENKNFLESEGIITFTDASGRLMALKPDVTMSIVKHTKPDAVSSKLYYVENVFRLAPQPVLLSGKCVPPQPGEPHLPGDQPDGPGVHWRPGRLCRG